MGAGSKLLPGDSSPDLVADYSADRLKAEARRMANNCRMTGMAYTAALLERLANEG